MVSTPEIHIRKMKFDITADDQRYLNFFRSLIVQALLEVSKQKGRSWDGAALGFCPYKMLIIIHLRYFPIIRVFRDA